ncbi:MAG TPA: cbb3-type cytochrome c oxidase subunit I [Actinomycetota bacterium]|nr:cbb3-type cytochrome c oxidase subunit I [Actinomycetota bacterium]
MADVRAGDTYQVEPDLAARQAAIAALVWLVIAAGAGALAQTSLLAPDAFPDAMSYGRLRAIFDSVFVFGWLASVVFLAVFAIVPRSVGAQLHNEVLGATVVVVWHLVLLAGVACLLLGLNQGRLLAEFPLGVDLALLALMALVAFNAIVTAVRRREESLYVSVWHLVAASILLPIVFAAGNFTNFSGVAERIVGSFYVSGLELLWLVPAGLGIAYYVVPVVTGNPLHSSRLARIGFWSLMFADSWAGQRTTAGGPGPDYVETIAAAMTLVLLIPVLSAASNLFATARGRWDALADSVSLRFAATGLVMLVAWVALSALTATRTVSSSLGMTSWQSGLRVLAWYGVFTSFGLALIYHVYPLLVGRVWFSRRAAAGHFWATVAGSMVAAAALMGAGIVQWVAQETAQRAGSDLAAALRTQGLAARPFQALAAAALAVVAAAQLALLWNAFRTAREGDPLSIAAAPDLAAVGV